MNKLILSIVFYFSFFNLIMAQSPSYFRLKDDGITHNIIRTTSSEFVTVCSDVSGGFKKLQITKWDSAFTELWSLEFDDTDINEGFCYIFESNNGSIYASASIMNLDEFVVFKIAASGSLIWQKTYGDASILNAWAFQKAAPGDDGFIFGTGACSSSNAIVKCDENGNIEWQKKYYHNAANAIITCQGIINDGNNYIISSGFNSNSVLNFRIDNQGVPLDYSVYTNTNNTMHCQGSIAYGSGYLVYGDFNSSIKSSWVAYFNSMHSLLLYNEFSMSDNTDLYMRGVSVDGSGQNILINGYIADGIPPSMIGYLFIASVSENGTINWKHKALGASDPFPTNPSFVVDVQFEDITAWSNKIVSVGNGSVFEGPFVSIMDDDGTGLCDPLETNLEVTHPVLTPQSGTFNVYNSNIFDSTSNYTYTTSIDYNRTYYCGDTTLGINNINNNQTELILYPNPFSNHLTIKIPSNKTYVLNVYDMLGNRVYLEQEVKENILLERGSLVAGVYMVELKSGHDTYRKKVIVR